MEVWRPVSETLLNGPADEINKLIGEWMEQLGLILNATDDGFDTEIYGWRGKGSDERIYILRIWRPVIDHNPEAEDLLAILNNPKVADGLLGDGEIYIWEQGPEIRIARMPGEPARM